MTRLHPSQKISIFMLVIILITGMCFTTLKADSNSGSLSQTESSLSFSYRILADTNRSACTTEMLRSRSGNIFEHVFTRNTRAGSLAIKAAYHMCTGIFMLPQKGFYTHALANRLPARLPNQNIILYLHKSDGKKRLISSFL